MVINLFSVNGNIVKKLIYKKVRESEYFGCTWNVKRKIQLDCQSTMLLGAANHCSNTSAAAAAVAAAAAAAAAASKNGTDFSIAAIMSRGSLSREPSERSLSKYNPINISLSNFNLKSPIYPNEFVNHMKNSNLLNQKKLLH